MSTLHVVEAAESHAGEVLELIHTAFGARQQLDPPSTALRETLESVAVALGEHGGMLVYVDGRPAGSLLFERHGSVMRFRRVSVDPQVHNRGVASALIGCAEDAAIERGCSAVSLGARLELPATQRFWRRRQYVEIDRHDSSVTFAKALPFELEVATADDTRAFGRRLADVLQAGDLLLLTGDLGAGKTTMTQGIGSGLNVRGEVTSPTFVISRLHPAVVDGPALVHVDAYRLGGVDELDDLDLDAALDEVVTVVEWGEGMAEGLAPNRLEIVVRRRHGTELETTEGDDPRRIKVKPVGRRWVGADLAPLRRPPVG